MHPCNNAALKVYGNLRGTPQRMPVEHSEWHLHHGATAREFDPRKCPPPWPPVPSFEGPVDAFLLHPYGDLDKSVETGSQFSVQLVYAASIAGSRFNLV
jgi:hypothetical protein